MIWKPRVRSKVTILIWNIIFQQANHTHLQLLYSNVWTLPYLYVFHQGHNQHRNTTQFWENYLDQEPPIISPEFKKASPVNQITFIWELQYTNNHHKEILLQTSCKIWLIIKSWMSNWYWVSFLLYLLLLQHIHLMSKQSCRDAITTRGTKRELAIEPSPSIGAHRVRMLS